MATARNRLDKHFRLDPLKIKRAQRILGAATPIKTIERVLDLVISEYEKNRLTAKAHDRFVRSGIRIRDVYGVLED